SQPWLRADRQLGPGTDLPPPVRLDESATGWSAANSVADEPDVCHGKPHVRAQCPAKDAGPAQNAERLRHGRRYGPSAGGRRGSGRGRVCSSGLAVSRAQRPLALVARLSHGGSAAVDRPATDPQHAPLGSPQATRCLVSVDTQPFINPNTQVV